MVAFLFLRVFKFTTPLSDYLQTSGMDYAQAWRQVSTVKEQVHAISRDFVAVEERANKFIFQMNKNLEELNSEIMVSNTFVQQRCRKKNKMPGDLASDETIQDPRQQFEVQVYNVVLDSIINQIDNRFSEHGKLYQSLELLDPKNFLRISTDEELLKIELFDGFRSILPDLDLERFRSELAQFSSEWALLRQPTIPTKPNTDAESNEDVCLEHSGQCQGYCLINCLKVLVDYNFFSSAYETLCTVYKTVLTLPMTQV
jgi:hypothetical protein